MTRKISKNRSGFTLMETLMAVALAAILVAVGIPLLSGRLEKSREATDLANVRSAYAQVLVASIDQDTSDPLYDPLLDRYFKSVALVQKQDGWVTDTDTLSIGGIEQKDRVHWKGDARANGTCVVSYDNRTGETTLIWNGYSVYVDYQWKNANGRLYMSEGSFDRTSWPASAVPEFIQAANQSGQKVVVYAIDDSFPTLKKWIDQGGGYEIGIFLTDQDGYELEDTGGRYISTQTPMAFEIATDKAEKGEKVQLAIQFFKMKSGTDHGKGSAKMTAQETRELERLFAISEQEEE